MCGVAGELIDVVLADEFCFDITLFSQLQDGSNLIVLGPQACRTPVSDQLPRPMECSYQNLCKQSPLPEKVAILTI